MTFRGIEVDKFAKIHVKVKGEIWRCFLVVEKVSIVVVLVTVLIIII